MPNPCAKRRAAHARRRAFEHHELDVHRSDLNAMVKAICATNGRNTLDVVHMAKLTNTTVLVALRWNGHWLPIVYQREKQQIRTILPAVELVKHGFIEPRLATPEEQKEDFLNNREVRVIITGPVISPRRSDLR